MKLIIKYLWFSATALLVVLLDQISKSLILDKMPLYERIPVIPGFFDLYHVHNPGGAFGFLAHNGSPWLHWMFLGAAFFAMGFILYFHHQTPRSHPYLAFGLSLIFGGAIGNLTDRFRYSEVVDFLDFYIAQYHWPTFNVADSAVTVGVGILIFHMVFKKMPF